MATALSIGQTAANSTRTLIIAAGSLALGAVIAVAMFALMRYLILTDAPPPEERVEAPNIDITSNRSDTELIRRDDRPEEPDEVKAPPPPPRIEAAKAEQPQEGLAALLGALPDINADAIDSGSINFVVADRDVQPLVRIPPQYPPRALERGLEGSCTMRFDVLPDGTIDSSTIQADCSSSLFARAATRAVERFRYAPKIVDGEAVIQRGITTDVEFQLAEE